MPDVTPSPAAERQRVYRARKRDGARIMRGDLSSEAVDVLIAEGWVGRDDSRDPVKLANAEIKPAVNAWIAGKTPVIQVSP